ncbi:protein phosphatase 2C domain-containing protein [Undibacterium cyanobacteriorum]|uniref:Protein phosphatase 2C domain-containing protein n=1 Tax=Undibacterium cyanobacteriorum TaxID=3073561 RepID=A0ABY9RQX6_9BURK|nr:protein phosphatase 2C domain-containing protein [Undibacterium sp. 20NA77.5]WMW82346.1 protein phosphatase 2C domain-containing protein [Undibacterium sp. 20NA77.5]
MSQYKIEAGTAQHIGDRKEQQDRVALFAAPNAPGHMMAVVADGMGGKSGGAIAAEQVIRSAKMLFDEFFPGNDINAMLEAIVQEAHTVIKLSAVSSEKEPHSTFAALVISPQKAVWAHVGDSRLYRFSGPNFAERTKDHSYVERLVDEGMITPEEAKNHKMSNVLVNVLGSKNAIPYVSFGEKRDLVAGDSFLLCSDGLWHYFSDSELSVAVGASTPRQASELMIRKARERANSHGDNISFAIVKLSPQPIEQKTYVAEKMTRVI